MSLATKVANKHVSFFTKTIKTNMTYLSTDSTQGIGGSFAITRKESIAVSASSQNNNYVVDILHGKRLSMLHFERLLDSMWGILLLEIVDVQIAGNWVNVLPDVLRKSGRIR